MRNLILALFVLALTSCGVCEPAQPLAPVPLTQAQVIHSVLDEVVEIETSKVNPDGSFEATGSGSGVLVDHRGFILTCWHVVEGQDLYVVTTPIGKRTARLVAKDTAQDLALIAIGDVESPAAEWGDSTVLEPGDMVFSVGYPFHIAELVSVGVVSAQLPEGPDGCAAVVTDAAVNPGNSGGGLFNSRGQLVGIPSRLFTPNRGGNCGIGLAIPSQLARLFVLTHLPKEAP